MAKDSVIIIDYGAGNIRSAMKAFEHVVREEKLDMEVKRSADPQDVLNASHVVLPGQGAFGDCITALKNTDGMIEALEETVLHGTTKFLGICVGMQLLMTEGHERGRHEGLGWMDGQVIAIPRTQTSLKIPHMGWNNVIIENSEKKTPQMLLCNTENKEKKAEDYYFVHSYMVKCKEESDILATVNYGSEIVAAIGRDNFIGVQFHPEKSQSAGLGMISRFLHWA